MTDVDECAPGGDNNCDPRRANCTNTVGSFQCSCIMGFTGDGTVDNCAGEWCYKYVCVYIYIHDAQGALIQCLFSTCIYPSQIISPCLKWAILMHVFGMYVCTYLHTCTVHTCMYVCTYVGYVVTLLVAVHAWITITYMLMYTDYVVTLLVEVWTRYV